MSTPTALDPAGLPATIRAYLAAHAAGETQAALRAFSPDAVVTDQGHTYHGAEEVLGFLRDAGSEFTYTTEVTGALRLDEQHWVAEVRLAGDFPGGVARVRYRFTVTGDEIAELVIAP